MNTLTPTPSTLVRKPDTVLKQVFGYSEFRDGQKESKERMKASLSSKSGFNSCEFRGRKIDSVVMVFLLY